jgi:NTP pyrophosphatase (non-canonical NTP hydrolase)
MGNTDQTIDNVIDWADKRNLLHRDNAPKQMMKVVEELGELASAIAKGRNDVEIMDAIGDVLVTVIILSQQVGLDPRACLDLAYDEIKGRSGTTIDGVFIKADDYEKR